MKLEVWKVKLEKNMYVRTETGQIGKITNFDGAMARVDTDKFITYKDFNSEITKASHNIIDLIEEDDLIKCQFGEQILMLQVGARYTTSHPENDWIKGVFTPDNEFWSLETLQQEDILQSIVTKEMFSNVEYRVETD